MADEIKKIDGAETQEKVATPGATSTRTLKRTPRFKEHSGETSQRRQHEKWGVLHIYSSYNNTHLHVTDVTGTETLVKVTGGMVTKSDRLKPTPNTALAAAKQVAQGLSNKGITALYVKLRSVGGHNGPMNAGPGAQAAIRTLTRLGIKVGRIEDVTPVPHDSCRRKGGRRGRRV